MGKLQGKVAVITGATQGIGFAPGKPFVREGAFVFITGRRHKELEEAVTSIGSNVTGVQGDASNLADLDRLYESVKARGRIDILFTNAGLGGFLPLGSITEEHYDQFFDTNVKGLLFTVQKALPLLNDGGSIILTGAALHPPEGAPAPERWRFHHSDRCGRGLQRHPQLRRRLCDQGGNSLIRANLDRGAEGPAHPHKRS